MKDLFIPYEEALVLKELGFDEPCVGFYFNRDKHLYWNFIKWLNYNLNNDRCSAPLYQQAFKWFREKYKLFVSIEYSTTNQKDFVITINKKTYNDARDEEYKTYEEAELASLKKLIKLVKK